MFEILSQFHPILPSTMISFGLLIGLQHALEADHLSAVSTQIVKTKVSHKSIKNSLKTSLTKSSVLGGFWGAGHTTAIALVGFLVYFLAITIQNEIFLGFEFLVAAMIVFLGATTILDKNFFRFGHRHPHKHTDGAIHFDAHNHNNESHKHNHTSYIIGAVHGLAGSGGLLVLMTATFESLEMVLFFVLLFGLGSIIGMILMSGMMGIPIALAQKTSKIKKILRYVAGTASILMGINIVYTIIFPEIFF